MTWQKIGNSIDSLICVNFMDEQKTGNADGWLEVEFQDKGNKFQGQPCTLHSILLEVQYKNIRLVEILMGNCQDKETKSLKQLPTQSVRGSYSIFLSHIKLQQSKTVETSHNWQATTSYRQSRCTVTPFFQAQLRSFAQIFCLFYWPTHHIFQL